MKLIQHKLRYGDLSISKDGTQDLERSVWPALIVVTKYTKPDRLTSIVLSWWKWGGTLDNAY